MSSQIVVSQKEQRHLVWQSEGFVDQPPASKRRSRPPPGTFSIAARLASTAAASASSTSPTLKKIPSKSHASKKSAPQRSTRARKVALAVVAAAAAECRDGEEDGSDAAGVDDDDDDAPTMYNVEAIVKTRTRYGAKEFLVRWEGYASEHDSWEPAENLVRCTVFQEYMAASRAARALRNASSVASDNAATAASAGAAGPALPSDLSPNTPPTPRKNKLQFVTPQRAVKNAASMRKRLLPGATASKKNAATSAQSQAQGPKLTFHSPSKRMPYIWGQLVSGHFGSGTPRKKAPSSNGGGSAPGAAGNRPVPVALRKSANGATSASSGAGTALAGAAARVLAPASRSPGKKGPASPASARFAHYRKLQKEIFSRRATASSAAVAGFAGPAAATSSLNDRIAAVRSTTPEPQPAAAAASASASASEIGLRPGWCGGECHWTNCLCPPPATA